MFAEVVFNKPVMPFTYELKNNLTGFSRGMRVTVDLRNKETVGIIYRTKDTPGISNVEIKPVKTVLDKEAVLNDDLIGEAMQYTSTRTKKGVIEEALRTFIQTKSKETWLRPCCSWRGIRPCGPALGRRAD